jgi:hypothetical protein
MTDHDADAPSCGDGRDDQHLSADPVLAFFRAARPEPPAELLSPYTEPHRALVEEILMSPSASTITSTDRQRRGRSRRRAAMSVAAGATVAAAAVGLVVASPFGSSDREADALIRDAAEATATAMSGSGRAVVSSEMTFDPSEPGDGQVLVWDLEFAGDDAGHVLRGNGIEERLVDGEVYNRDPNSPPEHAGWERDACSQDHNEFQTPVPAMPFLLAVLTPNADFEVGGDDVIAGVPTTRLHANTPGAVPAENLEPGIDPATALTALDVWVDDDDVIRRVDYTTRTVYETATADDPPVTQTETVTNAMSIVFKDLGGDVVIVAPARFEDGCPQG